MDGNIVSVELIKLWEFVFIEDGLSHRSAAAQNTDLKELVEAGLTEQFY